MKKMLATAAAAALLATTAFAEPVKVGMITTLSGGGAGLGIDVRDGFMLAVKQSGNKDIRSEEHTSELQSRSDLVCRLLLEKKKKKKKKKKSTT